MRRQEGGGVSPSFRVPHPGQPSLPNFKVERKQEMQFAGYKKSFGEDQRLDRNGNLSGVFCRASTVGPREGGGGEQLHGQCHCQNLVTGDKGQG